MPNTYLTKAVVATGKCPNGHDISLPELRVQQSSVERGRYPRIREKCRTCYDAYQYAMIECKRCGVEKERGKMCQACKNEKLRQSRAAARAANPGGQLERNYAHSPKASLTQLLERMAGSFPFTVEVLDGAVCGPETADLFVTVGHMPPQQFRQARAICAGCPVRAWCLDQNLELARSVRVRGVVGGVYFDNDGRMLADGPRQGRPRDAEQIPA